MVVLWPRGSKLLSVDRSACLWIGVVILVVVLARGYWVPNWETHGARQPIPSTDPARRRSAYL